ncbi:uncharacterized protein LOC129236127 isoform X1 [Anastrepha obliqua]|uniref:uncharacterized protein LOC129236127 isoform X1 n=2 Tax=Anastrepha obliqua TaxID=95512 RepID=UPI0024094F2F|nr:uncharacterized protein LOC129236127 isoform X1 [Anastrepha obliqua]
MSQMDTSQVQMVRSAKGIDMLCVDNFLYHFVDRGNKRCRWVCNRLKSKYQPCRSRIATVIIDGDESQHKVVRVTSEHTHERCSEKEISKVVERKLKADIAGKPCTLKNKHLKYKQDLSLEEQEEEPISSIQNDEGMESDEWPADDENDMYPKQTKAKKLTFEDTNVYEGANDDSALQGGGYFFNFEKEKLYMLKTALGRQMICVEGFLYRLESKSITSSTHRWECIKQDPQCKARILTEYLSNGTHRLKDRQLVDHNHDGYTPWKLTKLLLKNNITVQTENGEEDKDFQSIEPLEVPQNEACTTLSNKPPKKRIIESFNAKTQNSPNEIGSCTQAKPRRLRTKAKPVTYTYSADPLAALSTSTKIDSDKAKFTFLPSAKGNKVLCLDNYIYHLDTRSPRNGRAYWTCLLRRDKFYKCNARVTTEMTNKGPIIVRVSGTHIHSDHSQDIKRRLCRSFVVLNAKKAGIKKENILNESGNELNEKFKEIVEKSKETIERSIGRLCKEEKDKDEQATLKSSKCLALDESTVSSFSSVLDSDDDHLDSTATLPTKLEEMRQGTKLHCAYDNSEIVSTITCENTQKQEVIFNSTYEDLVEEMAAGDEMEVEYLDINTYTNNDDHLDISACANNDYFGLPGDRQKALFETSLTLDTEMNLNNVSTLRSAKGGELLCVDGYIYHLKSTQNNRTYWSCIKCKDPELNCKSRVSTITVNNEIRVFRTTNHHTHAVIESDIKRRLYNEIQNDKNVKMTEQAFEGSIDALNVKYTKILGKDSSTKKGLDNFDTEIEDAIGMTMKLYAVSDGPPSLAVRMVLHALNIPYELVSIDFIAGQHMTDEYAKMNPQKEIPVLDDDGFYLPESVAIMQYLCDKYSPTSKLYPREATQRAIVNHRMCFNMGFYYSAISAHSMAPIFFDYQRTDMSLKKVNNALNVFETYLQEGGTKYAAADFLTIADFALVSATLCLEAISFDLSNYPLVQKWYETFKKENPELWEIAKSGMLEIAEFEKNPPDLSHMNHPFHPTRKPKV